MKFLPELALYALTANAATISSAERPTTYPQLKVDSRGNQCSDYVSKPLTKVPHECVYHVVCTSVPKEAAVNCFEPGKEPNGMISLKELSGLSDWCQKQAICGRHTSKDSSNTQSRGNVPNASQVKREVQLEEVFPVRGEWEEDVRDEEEEKAWNVEDEWEDEVEEEKEKENGEEGWMWEDEWKEELETIKKGKTIDENWDEKPVDVEEFEGETPDPVSWKDSKRPEGGFVRPPPPPLRHGDFQ